MQEPKHPSSAQRNLSKTVSRYVVFIPSTAQESRCFVEWIRNIMSETLASDERAPWFHDHSRSWKRWRAVVVHLRSAGCMQKTRSNWSVYISRETSSLSLETPLTCHGGNDTAIIPLTQQVVLAFCGLQISSRRRGLFRHLV